MCVCVCVCVCVCSLLEACVAQVCVVDAHDAVILLKQTLLLRLPTDLQSPNQQPKSPDTHTHTHTRAHAHTHTHGKSYLKAHL